MADPSADPREEWARKYREAVAPFLGGEEVEAVGVFTREYEADSTQGWIDLVDLIQAVLRPFRKKGQGRLAKLPKRFLLAVTTEKVHILAFREGGSGDDWRHPLPKGQIAADEQIAVFDRKAISFTKRWGTWTEFPVLELMADGEHNRIDIKKDDLDRGTNPWAAEVVAALRQAKDPEAAGLSE